MGVSATLYGAWGWPRWGGLWGVTDSLQTPKGSEGTWGGGHWGVTDLMGTLGVVEGTRGRWGGNSGASSTLYGPQGV